MISEKNFSFGNERKESEPKIVIKRSSDAPPEVKQNPFYDEEYWGRAYSSDDIFLPDSDEALSFALAAHEIGHLIKEGERNDTGLDNYEATHAEEQRAWDRGWDYLLKYLAEYFQDRPGDENKIQEAFENIKNLTMQATEFSEEMYLEKGSLDELSDDDKEKILEQKRNEFYSKKGAEFKEIFNKIKQEKIGVKPDWEKFVSVVTKAVQDIIRDNNEYEKLSKTEE